MSRPQQLGRPAHHGLPAALERGANAQIQRLGNWLAPQPPAPQNVVVAPQQLQFVGAGDRVLTSVPGVYRRAQIETLARALGVRVLRA